MDTAFVDNQIDKELKNILCVSLLVLKAYLGYDAYVL